MSTRQLIRYPVAIVVVALLAGATVGIAAQEASPAAGPVDRRAAYPVAIHQGTCEVPVAAPVGPTIDAAVAGRDDDSEMLGLGKEEPVLVASATVDGTLEGFTGSPHIVAVHASAETFDTIVACGEIVGYEDDGRLVFALRGVDGAQVSGIAILDDDPSFLDKALAEIDLGENELSLTVFVIPGDTEESST